MNTSQFMDKQIMDLTSSSSTTQQSQVSLSSSSPPKQSSKDFIDLMNPPQDDDHHHQSLYNTDSIIGGADNGIRKEEILPNYDFQPIRPIASSLDSSTIAGISGGAAASSRNYGSLDSIEPAKVVVEKDQNALGAAIVMEIDKTMKKHADSLLHIMEGVSARLTQLESRTRNLENSVDDLKLSVGNNNGSTDGKMRQLENILREVHSGVQVLKEKQEVVEAELQLAKLQVSKADQQQSETQHSGHMGTIVHQAASAPPQSHQQLQQAACAPPQSHQQLPPVSFPQSIPPVSVPLPAVPPPTLPLQNLPPQAPLPNQFPQSQIPSVPHREPYYSASGQTQEPPNPQYQVPPSQQPQPSSAAPPPHQPYQLVPQPHYSLPPQLPQPQPSAAHHPEEAPYVPPQSYPPSLRQPSSQSPSGAPTSQPFYVAPSPHMFEPPSNRPSSGFPAAYGPPSGPTEPYPYGGSSSQYGGNTTMKPQQLSSSSMSQSGGSGYPQLPTARVLPHALPTASGVGSGSGSSGTGNRVPIDDVVDKVTNMGFPREHVRATVRKLTENGQQVDLNIVLDKLMNDGEVQPQRGWFGR
ncbi:hypothetical protein JCGZ_09575 [Jatropha curcas]|uniref:DUF1421 domain-containing protein n=1 Tax=Jatropha curcas TaxID=180498 RepID=A0A067LA45_JATCU|nr:translation initiation factor IF-2 isoform X2 [Jatropha curcas]KDP45326.1 hypothetical protein JCGZ_09575 [Jatropha curcas]